jgi:flagellar protein FlaJ
MRFKIPFTFSSTEMLKRKSKGMAKVSRKIRPGTLDSYLKSSDCGLSKQEYLKICLRTSFIYFGILTAIFTTILFMLNVRLFFLYGLSAGFALFIFIFFQQITYPKAYITARTRNIERNLIPAMQDMHVQLNSGVPLFKILVNVSLADYGSVSDEIAKAVREINSGKPQIEAIDELGNRTDSIYFRRILWQISNGMRAGSDMSLVIKDGIDNLTKEQVIQLQSYGNRLNPLIMFYMLLAVIMPALGLTFLTIISSMLNLSASILKTIFIGIFFFVVIMQIMFIGIIKNRRPSLL